MDVQYCDLKAFLKLNMHICGLHCIDLCRLGQMFMGLKLLIQQMIFRKQKRVFIQLGSEKEEAHTQHSQYHWTQG